MTGSENGSKDRDMGGEDEAMLDADDKNRDSGKDGN